MRYFVFSPAPYDDEGLFGQITTRVSDREGQKLESTDIPVGISEIRKGLDVRQAGDGYLRVNLRIRIGDLLNYRVACNPVISAQAIKIFDEAGIRFDQATFRWPLHVFSQAREHRRDYVVLWTLRNWDVLDWSKADVKYYSGTKVVFEGQALGIGSCEDARSRPLRDGARAILACFRTAGQMRRECPSDGL